VLTAEAGLVGPASSRHLSSPRIEPRGRKRVSERARKLVVYASIAKFNAGKLFRNGSVFRWPPLRNLIRVLRGLCQFPKPTLGAARTSPQDRTKRRKRVKALIRPRPYLAATSRQQGEGRCECDICQ
jgi:hypothetical protein